MIEGLTRGLDWSESPEVTIDRLINKINEIVEVVNRVLVQSENVVPPEADYSKSFPGNTPRQTYSSGCDCSACTASRKRSGLC